MDKNLSPDEQRESASLALHHILTHLSCLHADQEWHPATWIVFHQLIILFSLRDQHSYEEWVFVVVDHSGLVNKALADKLPADATDEPFQAFVTLGNWFASADPDDDNEGCVRIVKKLREVRNELLSKRDNAFAYLLTQSNLEIQSPYLESDWHPEVHGVVRQTRDLLDGRFTVESLQIEVPSQVREDGIQNAIFDYFRNQGLIVVENGMFTGSVYDNDQWVCGTSISMEKGSRNSVAIVTLTRALPQMSKAVQV